MNPFDTCPYCKSPRVAMSADSVYFECKTVTFKTDMDAVSPVCKRIVALLEENKNLQEELRLCKQLNENIRN